MRRRTTATAQRSAASGTARRASARRASGLPMFETYSRLWRPRHFADEAENVTLSAHADDDLLIGKSAEEIRVMYRGLLEACEMQGLRAQEEKLRLPSIMPSGPVLVGSTT